VSPETSSPRFSNLIYLERLTLDWLWQHAPRLVRTKATKKWQVFYIDHDACALMLARALAGICPVVFKEFRFRYDDIRDKDGICVRLKVAYHDLAVVANFIRRSFPMGLKADHRLALYVMKTPLYIDDPYSDGKYRLLRQAIILMNFVRWHADHMNAPEAPQLHLFARSFGRELNEYAQSMGLQPCPMKPYRSWKTPWQNMARKFLKLNGRLLKSLLRHAWVKIFPPKEQHQVSFSAAGAKLLVESRLEFNLDRPQCVSDLFFLDDQGGIQGQDVVLLFNGILNPVDDQKFEAMGQRHIQTMALTPQSSLVATSKVPVFSVGKTAKVMDKPVYFDELSNDCTLLVAQYARSRGFWEAFFKQNNIKLWTSFYKNEPEHIALADALAASGGVSTIYQRSYESGPSIVPALGSDIVFSFSGAEYDIEMQSGSDFRWHMATGFLGDYRFKHLSSSATALRQRLAQAGPKHVVAYFDEVTVDDGRWFYDHHFVQKNYTFWLEKLLANPSLGLVFKPKVPKTLRRRLGDVAKLLTRAEKTGRCYVFEGGEPQSLFPPAAASLASDIAIHEGICPGSAGVESALAGTRTLLMDFEGWPLTPLYKLGDEVVFKDWDSAWKACLEYFKNPAGHPRLGDWSAMLNELDPFRDGLAAHRMSCCLKELLEGLRRKEDRLDVMDRMVENYARRWGKDKVRRGPAK
jgi:hypothetical protein